MSHARFLVGDVFERMAELPDASVDLVLTSPPFLALRSYLPADHPEKAKEIGNEPTPAAFLDTLLALTAEWRRLLAPHGSLCVELGDTYSGSGGAGGDYNPGGLREGQEKFDGSAYRLRDETKYQRVSNTVDGAHPIRNLHGKVQGGGDGWPLAKSLCLIPELYRVALVYGLNPLTGEPSPAGQFRARNVVRWCRPNPPVGALGDKFRPATSEMVVACTSGKRWFDLDAVREPFKGNQSGNALTFASHRRGDENGRRGGGVADVDYTQGAGAPPLDWWEIPTQPYPGSHYATWPEALLLKPIKAMCPQRVCRECGKPSERITSEPEYVSLRGATSRGMSEGDRRDVGVNQWTAPDGSNGSGWQRQTETLGWTDCGHDAWRPGTVLDPFAGSGTTLAVATGHGRNAIGIDLDERNADLARERVGMFLEVDMPSGESVA